MLKRLFHTLLPAPWCTFLGDLFYGIRESIPDGLKRRVLALGEWYHSVFVRRHFRARSYYPECKLKPALVIAMEQLFLALKWGGYHSRVTNIYFAFGLDRKGIDRRDYLFLQEGNKYVILLNAYPYDQYPLLQNKMFAKACLCAQGVRVPEEYGVLVADNGLLTLKTGQGELDFKSWLMAEERHLFCKLLDGNCGAGAFPLDTGATGELLVNDRPAAWDDFASTLSGRYLVEERLVQHEALEALHPSSVNTVRMITVMRDGEPFVIRRVLRVGVGASTIDNWAAGGIGIDVDSSGRLSRYGVYKPQFKPDYTGRVEKHPDSQIAFEGFEIPYFQEAIDMVLRAHRVFDQCFSVGWDIAITTRGPVWVEGNADWDNEFPQAAGGGLRREFEQYFLPRYREMKRKRLHVQVREWRAVR